MPAIEWPVSGWTEIAAVHANAAESGPRMEIDARAGRALVQVRLAPRGPRRQADHRHHRHAAIEHNADVRRASFADVGEDLVADDPLLDDRPVGLPLQRVKAGEDRGDVVVEIGERVALAAGGEELPPVVPGDDDDPAARAARRRLDDEFRPVAGKIQEPFHVAVALDQGVGLGHGDAGRVADGLGDVLFVHAGIEARGFSGRTKRPLRRLMPTMPACFNSLGQAQEPPNRGRTPCASSFNRSLLLGFMGYSFGWTRSRNRTSSVRR